MFICITIVYDEMINDVCFGTEILLYKILLIMLSHCL
jgi:hypothetical protein